jgi:hypothetical protein
MDNLPVISVKLQRLRRAAKALAAAGFEEQAIELMRISRGEVKIKPGETLFGMSPIELSNARACWSTGIAQQCCSYEKGFQGRIP